MSSKFTTNLDNAIESYFESELEESRQQYQTNAEFRALVDQARDLIKNRIGQPSPTTYVIQLQTPASSEKSARNLARTLISTLADCFLLASGVLNPALGGKRSEEFEIPLEEYFRKFCNLPEDATQAWSEATLSFQQRVNGIHLSLDDAPAGSGIVVFLGDNELVTLNQSRASILLRCDAQEPQTTRFVIVPFDIPESV